MGGGTKAPKPLLFSQLIQYAPSPAKVRMQGDPPSHNPPGPTVYFPCFISHLCLGQQVCCSRCSVLKGCPLCSARAMWPQPLECFLNVLSLRQVNLKNGSLLQQSLDFKIMAST